MKYSDILKQYAVWSDTTVDAKMMDSVLKEEYIKSLIDFCKPEDLIGVSPSSGCFVFNQYLDEHGKKRTGKNTFIRMVKETFDLDIKVVQTDYAGRYASVFVFSDEV